MKKQNLQISLLIAFSLLIHALPVLAHKYINFNVLPSKSAASFYCEDDDKVKYYENEVGFDYCVENKKFIEKLDKNTIPTIGIIVKGKRK